MTIPEVKFKLHFASEGNVLATLRDSPESFMLGDKVQIANVYYTVVGREWQVRQAGHDVVDEECSLVVWVKR
jgi:hypothetical protein